MLEQVSQQSAVSAMTPYEERTVRLHCAFPAGLLALGALSASALPAWATPAHPAPVQLAPGKYRAQYGNATAELQLVPVENSLLFKVRAAGKLPPLAVQADLLRSLLPAVLGGTRPARLYFLPSANGTLVDMLGAVLAKDASWNARSGTPRSTAKRLTIYLVDRINTSEVARPFVDAFAASGYRLSASTASGVLVRSRADLHGACVPVVISELGFDAVPVSHRSPS